VLFLACLLLNGTSALFRLLVLRTVEINQIMVKKTFVKIIEIQVKRVSTFYDKI